MCSHSWGSQPYSQILICHAKDPSGPDARDPLRQRYAECRRCFTGSHAIRQVAESVVAWIQESA